MDGNTKNNTSLINHQNNSKKGNKLSKFRKMLKRDYQLYLLALPAIVYFIVFHYVPMYGIQIAFKNFMPMKGIWGSAWVGFSNFNRFFSSYQFWNLLKNTLGLSLFQLIAGFPIPIILALMLNQTTFLKFKKFVQTITYAPHFISIVVMVGMLAIFLSPRNGLINEIIKAFGGEPVFFMGEPSLFQRIYVLSGIWQNTGWGTIIYLAALAGVSTELYEAAKIDGANKWNLIVHVDLPCIIPTAIILLILNVGSIMNVGFQKVYLMQNPLNMGAAEVISTYVYKVGLINAQYSYSTAIGLFNTIINVILLLSVNKIAKKFGETSLW